MLRYVFLATVITITLQAYLNSSRFVFARARPVLGPNHLHGLIACVGLAYGYRSIPTAHNQNPIFSALA